MTRRHFFSAVSDYYFKLNEETSVFPSLLSGVISSDTVGDGPQKQVLQKLMLKRKLWVQIVVLVVCRCVPPEVHQRPAGGANRSLLQPKRHHWRKARCLFAIFHKAWESVHRQAGNRKHDQSWSEAGTVEQIIKSNVHSFPSGRHGPQIQLRSRFPAIAVSQQGRVRPNRRAIART